MKKVLVAAGAVAVVLALGATPAAAGPDRIGPPAPKHTVELTVMGTTDLHGNIENWDYFKNAEFSDKNGNHVGLAKVASLVEQVRQEHPQALLLDAGDTIQGTPLAYYYAKIDPITEGAMHPMAKAMNAMRYDAAALGNHEFNYGLDTLRTFESQLNFPLLGANAVDWDTGEPVFPPYIIKTVKLGNDKPVKVGILGLTNPGSAIWDKANVEGKVKFPGLVEQAHKYVPEMKAKGADVVIVSAHSGPITSSSYGDALPYPENASSLVAEQVPDVDAILVGHAHLEVPEKFVTNEQTGEQVLLTEPLMWGMRLSVMDFTLEKVRGQWQVVDKGSKVLNSNSVEPAPEIRELIAEDHGKVVDYVNSVIGESKAEMSAATARYEDTPVLDFINHVQADTVKQALAGTEHADLPVLSIAAPFNRNASIPQGDVTVRDVAGLYIYDNTLLAVTLTGSQVKDFLEQSAEYFKQVSGAGPYAADEVTNAPTSRAPNGTPDYNYDVVGGLDAPLTYDIDISQAPGSRISDLAYDGEPVAADQQFVVAINNYRQSGGGSFPHVANAPVVYNRQVEVRQLLIDWVTAQGVIDPAAFSSVDWRLVAGGQPVQITP